MAKASKKVAKKAAKKATPKKAVKKAIKKAAKKAPAKTVKKAAKKVAPKKAAPKKAAKKAVKKTAPAPEKQSGKKFLIVYNAPMEAMAQMANLTPEEQAASMEIWNAWAAKAGKRLIDLGAPLISGKRLHNDGSVNEGNKEVTGYSLLQADDWDEIMRLIEGHPHLSGWHPDATIEIHETMLMPGM
jgi:hypothetical protein